MMMNQFGPSYTWVEPQNREAYVWLKEWTEGESTWQEPNKGSDWKGSRVLVDVRYLDNLVAGAEDEGYVFKKKEEQKPGPVDFIAFVAW